jgi:hypothetical protein
MRDACMVADAEADEVDALEKFTEGNKGNEDR